jgi:hypothetical protein
VFRHRRAGADEGHGQKRRHGDEAERLDRFQVSHTQFPSTGPYFVVAAGIVVSVLVVAWLIGRLNRLYVQITGTNRLAPIRPTWLRSMRDTSSAQGTTTVVEAVLMGSVILAAITLTVWFFLLAGSPIPNQ